MKNNEFDLCDGRYPEVLRDLFQTMDGDDCLKIGLDGEDFLEIAMKHAFDLGKSLGPDDSADGVKKAWDTYSELKTTLEGLPSTWYPALIGAMVEAAYSRPIFVPGGASRYIGNLEGRIGKAAAPVPEGEGPMTLVHIKTGNGRNEYPVHRDVRALIDGLTGSIQILRESVNAERAGRIDPELARKALASLGLAERENNRVASDGADFRMSIPAQPNRDSDLVIGKGLEDGLKLAEAVLAQAKPVSGPGRILPAELEAAIAEAAATTAMGKNVAETCEQPMDVTELVVTGLKEIERLASGDCAHDKVGTLAREIRLALTGERA